MHGPMNIILPLRAASARLLGLRVRILPEERLSLVKVVLSGRRLCVGVIIRSGNVLIDCHYSLRNNPEERCSVTSRRKPQITHNLYIYILKLNSVALVRERTIPTERPPPVGEVSANFCGEGCHVVSATDPHGR